MFHWHVLCCRTLELQQECWVSAAPPFPQVTARLRELHSTIEAGERHRNAVLQTISFNLEEWTTKVGATHAARGMWSVRGWPSCAALPLLCLGSGHGLGLLAGHVDA